MKIKQTLRFMGILLICMPTLGFTVCKQKDTTEQYRWKLVTEKIDRLLQAEFGANAPGGSIGIFYGKDREFKKSYGSSDLSANLSNNLHTAYNIASVSKHFTAYAILLLEQDGLLKLDDPIGNYLPELPAYKSKVSIRQLIQHTSGIASTDVLRLLANSDFETSWSQEDELDMIKSYPMLNTEPNTEINYSNSGYILLAEIIEKITNMTYAEFMNKHIFFPLSMNSSFVFHSPQQASQLTCKGYKKEADQYTPYPPGTNYTYGSGNTYSSVNDMLNWGKHILRDKTGCKNYLSLVSNQYNTLTNGDSIHYTYAFKTTPYKGIQEVRISGGDFGYRSQFALFPSHNLCIVILLNTESTNSYRLLHQLCDLLLADQIEEPVPVQRKEIQVDSELLQSYTGKFRTPNGMLMDIKLNKDSLHLHVPGGHKFRLYAESKSSFFLKAFDAQCEFRKDSTAFTNELIWKQNGSREKCMRIQQFECLTKEMLEEFVGNYTNKALNVSYPVRIENNQLILFLPQTFKSILNIPNPVIEYMGEDYFYAGRLDMLKFERNELGEVKALVIQDIGRVKKFRLIKECGRR